MKHKWLSILISVAIGLSLWGLMPLSIAMAADSDIVISEVAFNATCLGTSDTVCSTSGTDETHFEWVEIYNKGTTAVSLNSWQICDLGGTPACDPLPNQTVQPGEYWIIAYNLSALQTEFNQYSPVETADPARTISLNSAIGGGLRNTLAEGIYLTNASAQDVTCVSWGAANTLCSSRTTLGSKIDTNFTTFNGQSITNISGVWYKHGPTDGAEQASPYGPNTSTSGPTAITLNTFTANSSTLPIAPLAVLGLIAVGGVIMVRRKQRKHA